MEKAIPMPQILAEVLRLQRWAGGEHVSADRVFGLMHGFETVIRQEAESYGISEETQDKVEDLLEDVENGKQSPDGPSIKDRLWREKIDETDALRVMELCRLQSRFTEGIELIAKAPGCIFAGLNKPRLPEQDWFGALHYMELVDCSAGERAKMHSVFAPSVPRVGEMVTPQRGTVMEVVDVEHVIISQGDDEGIKQHYLVPHVILKSIEEEDGESDEED
jgi:hypothetical protein